MMFKNKEFRMVEIQIMNMVNHGMKNDIQIEDVKILGNSIINACQLFLNDNQILKLKGYFNSKLSNYHKCKK